MNPGRWRVGRAAAAVGVVVGLLAGCATGSADEAAEIPGCGRGSDGPLVLVVSGRSMSAGPNLSPGLLEVVAEAVAAQRPVVLVNADGSPAALGTFPVLGQSPGTSGYEREVRNLVDDIATRVAQVRADSPQIDVLGSMDVGVRAARDLSDRPPVIVVADSLLSTVPPIDFTRPGMLSADPDEIVESLRSTFGLPDLRGGSVLFYGVGNVAQPQQPLPPGLRRAVADIWEAVATASGAACVASVEVAGDGRSPDGVPTVDPVPVPTIEPAALSERPTVLGSDIVRFRPDSAELVDPQEAGRVIDAIVAQLLAEPPMCIDLVGTTATGTPGHGPDAVALSEARAYAVEGLLIAAGIPDDVIHPRGIGAAPFDGRVNDIDATGVSIPAAAALNRTVRIEQCR